MAFFFFLHNLKSDSLKYKKKRKKLQGKEDFIYLFGNTLQYGLFY